MFGNSVFISTGLLDCCEFGILLMVNIFKTVNNLKKKSSRVWHFL